MRIYLIPICAIFLLMISCNQNSRIDDFPKIVSLNQLKETNFAISLEDKFSNAKNIVYSPTVLYAWNEMKKRLKSDYFTSDKVDSDFTLLNSSHSYIKSLNNDEYNTEVSQDENTNMIIIKAYFNKILPFKYKFQVVDKFMFKEEVVKGFGLTKYNRLIAKSIAIIYYKDSNEFIVKLEPADTTNEIILIKGGSNKMNSFNEVLMYYKQKIQEGVGLEKSKTESWKVEYMEEDVLIIPQIKFNIDKEYYNLAGFQFKDSKENLHFIESLMQRNAFVLDANGAKVESEARLVADSIGFVQPKKMYFNQDFYIFLKKKNIENPYFALKIVNSELMNKN